MDQYKVNVSAINLYAKCPFRWWAQFVMNWVPRNEAQPLAFGRLLHEVFEMHARGNTMEKSLRDRRCWWHSAMISTNDSFEQVIRREAIEQLDELSEALLQWKDSYDFQIPVLEAEEPFELTYHPIEESYPIILVGRPDRVAVMGNRIWHVQNRGLSSSVNFGVYTELAKRHYHEHVYAEALNKKYCPPSTWENINTIYGYGGTVFNLVRKLKYRTKVTKKNPEGEVKELSEMFYQYPMSIDLKSPLHEHVMKCVVEYAYQMRQAEYLWKEEGIIPLPNEDMNGGRYGNSPDEYFRVLTGEIELGDERYFKKRIDPYALVT